MSDQSTDPQDDRPLILVSQDGAVRTIEMNRPEKRNPIGFRMAQAIGDAVAEADADPSVKAIIIGGIGETFSGGHDLSAEGLKEYTDLCRSPETTWTGEERYFFRKVGMDIWHTDTPTIARVQGAAVIGAFALANVCDLIVASEEAEFWTPATRMYGFGAEVFMEPWVMGARRAKEYLFTGDAMSAQEAYRVGMVNRVVPLDQLESRTMELAQHIAKNTALGLKMVKRAINKTMDFQGFSNAIDHSFLFHIFSHSTEEFQEKMWKPLIRQVNEEGLRSYVAGRDRGHEPDES